MIVLIPAYKPDNSLILLCKKLLTRRNGADTGMEILVVDDGSGTEFASIFEAVRGLGPSVHVLTQPVNGGKGAALRAGFIWCLENRPDQCVVTADADGQHLPADILAVGIATEIRAEAQEPALVMGVRTVEDPAAPSDLKIPLRSRFGNATTVGFFTLATGKKVVDTQTGLRGLTPDILVWATELPGDRYEYEFNMLLRATKATMSIEQVPITRVYEPGNPTSHFQPVRDSLRIYAPLLLFFLASISGFVVDTIALLIFSAVIPLIAAVFLARITSGLVNYAMNRWVISGHGNVLPHGKALTRYAILAVGLLLLNAGMLEALSFIGFNLLLAKILVELALVPISFAAQHRWVFAGKKKDVAQQVSSIDEESRALAA